MKNILLILMVLVTMVSCEEEDEIKMPIMFGDGTYVGTFSRSAPNIKCEVSNVTLTFDKGQFIGEGSKPLYPAMCNGSFVFNGETIDFKNECGWLAHFDWTFILDGTFKVETSGDKLIIKRDYANQVTDMYVLTMQKVN